MNIKCYQNMGPSLKFQFFSMAISIVRVVSSTALRGDTSNTEKTDEDPPLLTCTLFNDNAACNAMCLILASIYVEPEASGTCSDKSCKCGIPPNFWKLKFDSLDILQEIRKNDDLSKKILEALKNPQQTPQQSKQYLTSISHLIPKQMEDLRMKEDDTIRKYVFEKLQSLQTPLESKVYKTQLMKTLDNADENTLNYILQAIRRSKNKRLNEFLDSYVKDRKITERPVKPDDQESVIDTLDIVIINEILKPTLRKTQPCIHSKSSKSNTSQVNLPGTQIKTLDSSDHEKIPVVEKHTKNTNVNIDKNLYTLEGFDKTMVTRFKEKQTNETWDQCWKKPNIYEVCITRNNFVESLYWFNMKQRIVIQIRIFRSGNVGQTWKFIGTGFELKRKSNGEIVQYWDLPNDASWEYTKTYLGEISQRWFGREDWKSVEYYKSFIDLWCAENSLYVGKENCIIY